jgi:hypothetical protein
MAESYNIADLTPKQSRILEGFVGHYSEITAQDARLTGYYDQTSAYARDSLVDRFEIDLEDSKNYYAVMAGLSVGTMWLEEIIDKGLSAQEAGEVLRATLARLSSNPT